MLSADAAEDFRQIVRQRHGDRGILYGVLRHGVANQAALAQVEMHLDQDAQYAWSQLFRKFRIDLPDWDVPPAAQLLQNLFGQTGSLGVEGGKTFRQPGNPVPIPPQKQQESDCSHFVVMNGEIGKMFQLRSQGPGQFIFAAALDFFFPRGPLVPLQLQTVPVLHPVSQ